MSYSLRTLVFVMLVGGPVVACAYWLFPGVKVNFAAIALGTLSFVAWFGIRYTLPR
jgi:hypothetical protein